MAILPAFFARVKPVSSIAKPACIMNTSVAASNVQMTLVDDMAPTSFPLLGMAV